MVRDEQSYHVSKMKFGFSSHVTVVVLDVVVSDRRHQRAWCYRWFTVRERKLVVNMNEISRLFPFFRQYKFDNKSKMCFVEGSFFLICFHTIPTSRHVQMIQPNNTYSFLKQTNVVEDVDGKKRKEISEQNYSNQITETAAVELRRVGSDDVWKWVKECVKCK